MQKNWKCLKKNSILWKRSLVSHVDTQTLTSILNYRNTEYDKIFRTFCAADSITFLKTWQRDIFEGKYLSHHSSVQNSARFGENFLQKFSVLDMHLVHIKLIEKLWCPILAQSVFSALKAYSNSVSRSSSICFYVREISLCTHVRKITI